MFTDAVKAEIVAAMTAAPRRDKRATAERLARLYRVHPSTIYKVSKRGGAPRKRQPLRPEYREWTRLAWTLANPPDLGQPLPLDLAIEAGVEGKLLPPEAAAMPVSTAYRLAVEMGLKARPKRTHRLHADYPMQAVQVDYSTSQYLLAERQDGDDWILKLHRRPVPASGYKNRPLSPHRQRVGVYALWDVCTGYVVERYIVSRGENAADALDFLCWALGQDKDSRLIMHGVPDDLWTDLGPLARNEAAADLLGRLGIALVTGEAYAKERMGGVERTHRTRWSRFERALFLLNTQTIRLSELNARCVKYTVRENEGRACRTPVGDRPASSAAGWTALTNRRPKDNPLRRLPDNPMETLTREVRRKIDVNGIVRWGGVEYEVADWHDRWVTARRAVDGSGDLTVEDEVDGEKRTAVRYAARPYGVIRSSPPSELQNLQAQPLPFTGADIYAPSGAGEQPSNVVPIPARSAPAAALENPLAGGDRCRDLGEAMRLFTSIYPWPLSPDNRALVVEQIEAAGLSREAITTLAQAMLELAYKKGGDR